MKFINYITEKKDKERKLFPREYHWIQHGILKANLTLARIV